MSYVSYTSCCTISLNLFIYFIVKHTWNDTVSFTVHFINKFIIIIIIIITIIIIIIIMNIKNLSPNTT